MTSRGKGRTFAARPDIGIKDGLVALLELHKDAQMSHDVPYSIV